MLLLIIIGGIIILFDIIFTILDKKWYYYFSIPITKKKEYKNIDFNLINTYGDKSYKTICIDDNIKLIRLKFNAFSTLGLWIPLFLPFTITFFKSLIEKKENSILISNHINISPFIFLIFIIYCLTLKHDIIGYSIDIIFILYMIILIVYNIKKQKKIIKNNTNNQAVN
jgi:hypothetical protein